MLRAVAEAFSTGDHLLVEASTGVGKSLAYLLPALKFAMQNNTRVVVATNTINLQDQLFHKDLPALAEVLGTRDFGSPDGREVVSAEDGAQTANPKSPRQNRKSKIENP